MKKLIFLFIVTLPFAFLANFLESRFGDSWLTVALFCVALVVARLLLYLYRKSKGVSDDFGE